MHDAHVHEMQCKCGSQTPGVLQAVRALVAPASSLSSSWSRARAQQPPSPKKDISLSDDDVNLTNANVAVVLRGKSAILSVRHWHVLLDTTGHLILSMHDKVSAQIGSAIIVHRTDVGEKIVQCATVLHSALQTKKFSESTIG